FQLILFRVGIVLIEHNPPIKASDGIVRNGIGGIELGILQVILMGFLEVVRVLVDACETGDRIDIAWIVLENVLECLNREFGILVVVFTAAARNELLRVGGTEVKFGRREIGVQF